MLEIKGKTLSAEGISFTLPDGFYIDIEGMEGVEKNGLRLVTPEKDCFIWMRSERNELDNAMDALLDSFSDFVCESGSQIELFEDPGNSQYKWIVRPRRYSHNGLTGACAVFTALKYDVIRLHLEPAPGYSEGFTFYIEIDRSESNYETVVTKAGMKEFFNSIRPAE